MHLQQGFIDPAKFLRVQIRVIDRTAYIPVHGKGKAAHGFIQVTVGKGSVLEIRQRFGAEEKTTEGGNAQFRQSMIGIQQRE